MLGARSNWVIAGALLLNTPFASAELLRLKVESRQSVTQPETPAFEILQGHFTGELDPRLPGNRIITDLAAAPRNARGRVEYAATFAVAVPLDLSASSGVLI